MGEGKVKTAFELAMEKVAAMPKLNTDELREERRKEAVAKGEIAAQKYLQNLHRKSDIRAELSAVGEEQRGYATASALKSLALELSLTQPELNRHILEGMSELNSNISIDKTRKKLDGIINDFIGEVRKARVDAEKSELAGLKKEGIAGSAVRPNLKASSSWQEIYAGLSTRYTGKLYEIQQSLLN